MRLLDCLRLCIPSACVLCGFPVHDTISLCRDCRAALPIIEHPCQVCGIALPAGWSPRTCGRCLLAPPAFDRCLSATLYQHPVRNLIMAFKFHGDFANGRVLAELLTSAFTRFYDCRAGTGAHAPIPSLIIPIPLHRHRLRQRGFNQALLLARAISRQTGIPLAAGLLVRHRDTVVQSQLPARQRNRNLRGAFRLARVPAGGDLQHIALVDDVVTTTATVGSAARVLRRAGAERIDVWSVARALGGGAEEKRKL